MDDLIADFVAETREMLEASQGEIIAWEADPSDRSRLDAIFRFVHTVKGNCGFFDFPRLEKLSHAAEDVLSDVRAGRRESNADLVTAILAIIDRIALMADAIEAGEEFAEDGDYALIAALQLPGQVTGIKDPEPSPEDSSRSANLAESKADPELSTPVQTNNGPAQVRSIRLPTELLDRVMSGVSDMVLARNDLAHRLRMSGQQPTIDGPFERLTSILSDVRDAVTRMRMQRIEHLFAMFPRLVRDLSQELGKQVLIEFEGGNVELDREMVEMIRDPLTHIVRNALDHGFETPSERLKAGKRETGLLSIVARQSGNRISIVITDDGRGLDAEKIAQKAIANGIFDQQRLAAMSRDEILQLVFEPGLSTAETVSSVSGRGVGLDVVRANLERVGGSIKVTSTPGVGALFYLTIPLTLSIISGLVIAQGEHSFAIPQSYVEEVIQLDSDTVEWATIGDRKLITFRGRRVPCLSLEEVLNVEHALSQSQRTAILLRLASGDLIAMIADNVKNISDLVVKPIPPIIMQTELYGGSTQLDDGTPILVLDIPQIALGAGLISDTRAQQSNLFDETGNTQSDGIYAMIFAGFDGRRTAMRMDLIQRIETVPSTALDLNGKVARVVIDGEVLDCLGLHGCQPATEKLRLLRISDGSSELAYAIQKVEDAAFLDEGLKPAKGEPMVEGIAILEGEPVVVIDSYALFAAYGNRSARQSGLTCAIPETEWAQSILRPLVQKCGYKVISAAQEEEPNVQIVMTGDLPGEAQPHATIVIRETEDDSAAQAHTVYRYDETALVEALRDARKKALAASRSNSNEEAA
ncbi:chemotaxis protein CheA [Altererythrobacter sp. GH1-8]|uniref:chemotaxis protein CheA n=1 Tax=Altererythrobacter sp. GH1-8 TaxID=3349333 RepID=UPI00374D0C8F